MICWKTPVWRWVGILISLIVIAKDQLIKWLIIVSVYHQQNPNFVGWLTQKADRFEQAPREVTSFFNLVMVWNQGVSFGMMRSDSPNMIYILSGVAVAISLGFFVWLWREPLPMHALCTGLITGGALSNVLDRWRFGAVADFFDFHIGRFHWPAFNIADSAITLGVILMLVHVLFFPHYQETKK